MDSEKWLNILLSGITSALIAVIIPMIVDRKKAWREARYKLIQDFQNIYMEVERISRNPHRFNAYTFNFLFESESIELQHYRKSFWFKKKKLKELEKKVLRIGKDMILNRGFEELLLRDGENSRVFNEFLSQMQYRITELGTVLLS